MTLTSFAHFPLKKQNPFSPSRIGQTAHRHIPKAARCITPGSQLFFVGSLRRRWNLILAARDEFFRQSAPLDREAIAAIPDGTYTAEGCLDNDGIGQEPVVVKVRIDVDGDQMSIDLADSLNGYGRSRECGIAQTISAARDAYKLLINADRPVDGGTFPTLTSRLQKARYSMLRNPLPASGTSSPSVCSLI